MSTNLNIFFIAATISALAACGNSNQQNNQSAKVYPVVIVPVRDVTGYTTFPTSIEGRVNNDVRAKISGYIREVLIDEGQAVSRGQVLFRLETNILTQNASAARGGVSAAAATIAAAKAAVNAAQVEVDKLVPLVEKNIISDVQLQTARANLLTAQSQLRQAQANHTQAQANYRGVAENIDYAVIRSPINGTVGKLPLRVGSLVGPTDPVPLTTVSDVSEVYAYFSMNEKDYLNFLNQTPGVTVPEKLNGLPPVELELANGETYPEKGRIKAVTGQIDPATGTILFRASFPNQRKLLSNGNSGTIKIPKPHNNVLVVPEAATFEQQGIVYVFKVSKDTVLQAVVGVIDRINNMALIGGGINKGDTIVASGISGLRNGMPVKPKMVDFDETVNAIKPIF